MQIAYIIILILIICIFIIVYLERDSKKVKIEEGFVTRDNLDNTTKVRNREMYGIEKCESLRYNQYSTSKNKWIPTMFLDTLRIKKWKPVEKLPSRSSNIEYCYYYADRDPNKTILQGTDSKRDLAPIADPISTNNPCTKKDNVLFKDIEFVTNVFPNSGSEKTIKENLKYDKCVIEIDKTKVNDTELDKLWTKLDPTKTGSLSCATNLAAIVAEQNRYIDEISKTNAEYNKLQTELTNQRNILNGYLSSNNLPLNTTWESRAAALSNCKALSNVEAKNLDDQQKRFVMLRDEVTKSFQEYQSEITAKTSFYKNNIEPDIKTMTTRIASLNMDNITYTKKVADMKLELSQLQQTSSQCQQDKDSLLKVYNDTLKQLELEKVRVTDLQQESDRLTIQITDLDAKTKTAKDRLELLQNDFTKRNDDLAKCQSVLNGLNLEAKYWYDALLYFKSRLDACRANYNHLASNKDHWEKLAIDYLRQLGVLDANLKDFIRLQIEQGIGIRKDFIMQAAEANKQRCNKWNEAQMKLADVRTDVSKMLQNMKYPTCAEIKPMCCP